MTTECVGIDIGYGFTKIYTQREGGPVTIMFPTAVSDFHGKITFSPLKPILVNGKRYIVGKPAADEGGTISTRTSSFVASDPWIAVLSYALNEAGFSGGDLVLGVPPGLYTREYGSGIIASIKNAQISVGSESNPYRFNGNVSIIPQGAGIFFHHVREHGEDFAKNVVVVDIGHRIVDITFFAGGKYVENAKATKNMGISVVLDDIVSSFASEHHIEISHREALMILETGKMTHLGNGYTVDPTKEREAYATQLTSLIESYLERINAVDLIILGGGGSLILTVLHGMRYKMSIVTEPQYANAIGYWCWGKSKQKNRGEAT